MHCTLLVPDLLPPGLHDAPQPRVPRLAALLARGSAGELPAGGMEAWLCESFGVARQHDWPVAALTLTADGGDPADGYWLRCDPVHLHISRNRMHLSAACGIPSDDEAIALIDALNAHFRDDGLHFQAGPAGRWYLRADKRNELTTQPLQAVLGHDIDGHMPAGADSSHWRQVLNEIQMLLHAHPVNEQREARGLPAVNSLWLWGGGRAPRVGAAPFTQVWSDDALARALAKTSGTPVAAPPADAAGVLGAGGEALVVLIAARDAGGNISAWLQAVEQLERDWFAPCHAALQRRQLATLTIVVTGPQRSRRFDIAPRDLWRWWRRLQPLHSHV